MSLFRPVVEPQGVFKAKVFLRFQNYHTNAFSQHYCLKSSQQAVNKSLNKKWCRIINCQRPFTLKLNFYFRKIHKQDIRSVEKKLVVTMTLKMNKQFCRVGLGGEKGHKSGWNGVILLLCEAKISSKKYTTFIVTFKAFRNSIYSASN